MQTTQIVCFIGNCLNHLYISVHGGSKCTTANWMPNYKTNHPNIEACPRGSCWPASMSLWRCLIISAIPDQKFASHLGKYGQYVVPLPSCGSQSSSGTLLLISRLEGNPFRLTTRHEGNEIGRKWKPLSRSVHEYTRHLQRRQIKAIASCYGTLKSCKQDDILSRLLRIKTRVTNGNG